MCSSCQLDRAIDSLEAIKERYENLIRLGDDMAKAIEKGVRELPKGGMRGQIANNPAEIEISENWKRLRGSLEAWQEYLWEIQA